MNKRIKNLFTVIRNTVILFYETIVILLSPIVELTKSMHYLILLIFNKNMRLDKLNEEYISQNNDLVSSIFKEGEMSRDIDTDIRYTEEDKVKIKAVAYSIFRLMVVPIIQIACIPKELANEFKAYIDYSFNSKCDC